VTWGQSIVFKKPIQVNARYQKSWQFKRKWKSCFL